MKIVIADEMEKEVVSKIAELGTIIYKPSDLKKELLDADALVVRSATKVTREVIMGSRIKIVARAGVGVDNIDQEACKKQGIKILNTPGASTNAVAELVVGLMIGALRNIQKAHHQMKGSKWEKKSLLGREIDGKTLGIIGYGRIGASVAKKASALGMKIVAYNPPPRHEDGVKYIDDLPTFLNEADVITLHAALTPETKNIINNQTIAKMKNGVVIINTARGEMVDENALYDAIKSGKVSSAAIDVYREEPYKGKLVDLENVYLSPHLGASTKEAQERIGEELVAVLKKELGK